MKANVCKIDSLRLFMPLDKISMNNIDDYTLVTIVKGTGEVKKETQPRSIVNDRGIKTSMVVETAPYGRANMVKGLSVAIPAKVLGNKYFDGINSSNARYVLDYLNSLNPDIQIPMNSFMNARASDIDFCFDSPILTDLDFRQLVKDLDLMCNLNPKIKHWNPSKNGEFYIATRKTATDSNPFGKLYRKQPEYKGSEHQETFFSDISFLKDNTRTEVTMKNKACLRRYSNGGIEGSYFNQILEGNYSSIVQNVFNHYFGESTKTIKPKMTKQISEFKPNEAAIYSLIQYAMNSYPRSNDKLIIVQTVFDMLCTFMSDRNKKTKRKQIELIFDSYISTDHTKKEKEFSQYLKNIGLSN